MAKTAIIMINASIVMVLSCISLFERQFFGDELIENNENGNGHSPLKQDGSHRSFGEYIEPVPWICLIAVPEPPDQHGDELNREEKHDEIIEGFAQFEFMTGARDDFFAELAGPHLEHKEYEERSTHHQPQSPDMVLIVEKSHANSGGNAENEAGDPHDGDSFFPGQSCVHEDAGYELQLGDERRKGCETEG